jgi:hypothetical protein
MRQPIHALSMLNGCLSDSLSALTCKEVQSCATDSLQMQEMLAHLMSLADDFLIYSSITSDSEFSLRLERLVLSDVCKRVELVCGTLAREKGSMFIVSLCDKLSEMPVALTPTRARAVHTRLNFHSRFWSPTCTGLPLLSLSQNCFSDYV